MKQGITKKKFCISIDKEIYDILQKECEDTDAKLSTRINSILKKYAKEMKKK
jgi:hypothetical protein